MKKKSKSWKVMNKKFWHNPYIVYVITSIITLIVGIVFRQGIWNVLVWLWNHFLNVSISIKIWWILIGIGLTYIIIKVIKALRKKSFFKYTSEIIELPPWAENISDDKKDRFIRWEWEYKADEAKPVIENIYPICRNCGTIMQTDYEYLSDYSVLVASCPRCYLKFQIPEIDNIKALVNDNIRRKYIIK